MMRLVEVPEQCCRSLCLELGLVFRRGPGYGSLGGSGTTAGLDKVRKAKQKRNGLNYSLPVLRVLRKDESFK